MLVFIKQGLDSHYTCVTMAMWNDLRWQKWVLCQLWRCNLKLFELDQFRIERFIRNWTTWNLHLIRSRLTGSLDIAGDPHHQTRQTLSSPAALIHNVLNLISFDLFSVHDENIRITLCLCTSSTRNTTEGSSEFWIHIFVANLHTNLTHKIVLL